MSLYRPPHEPFALQKWFTKRPLLAERAAIALCRVVATKVNGTPWISMTRDERIDRETFYANKAWKDGDPVPMVTIQTRNPPLPSFRVLFGKDHKKWPKNRCPVCAQPCYQGGDWNPAAGKPRWNKHWHAPCFEAATTWRKPTDMAGWLARRQDGRCAITGEPLMRDGYVLGGIEVDHIVPLWRVRLEADQHRWPDVLRFWGPKNLQALSAEGHREKTRREAAERADFKKLNILGRSSVSQGRPPDRTDTAGGPP